MSDVSDIPQHLMPLIEGCELLIIDAVEYGETHPSHFTYSRCIEEIRRIKPKKAYMIGMVNTIIENQFNSRITILITTK